MQLESVFSAGYGNLRKARGLSRLMVVELSSVRASHGLAAGNCPYFKHRNHLARKNPRGQETA